MNKSKRCKVLPKFLDVVYDEYPDTKDFIDRLLEEICRSNFNTSTAFFLFLLVFFAIVFIIIYGFLCLVFTKPKLKNMLLVIAKKRSHKEQ